MLHSDSGLISRLLGGSLDQLVFGEELVDHEFQGSRVPVLNGIV